MKVKTGSLISIYLDFLVWVYLFRLFLTFSYARFFLKKQDFHKNHQAEIGKKLRKAKQHPEAELLTKMFK